jgi:hypothetical protein
MKIDPQKDSLPDGGLGQYPEARLPSPWDKTQRDGQGGRLRPDRKGSEKADEGITREARETKGKPMSYAQGTEVPIERSKGEIEHILAKYGADGFGYMIERTRAVIAFRAGNRNIRFILPLPKAVDVAQTPTGRKRKTRVIDDALLQETRRRWRALSLSIKAKLETVSSGIAEFEEEFMPYIVMPGGKTVAEQLRPQIEEVYTSGKRFPLLLSAD